jgi:hypothetical protein
VNFFDKVIFTGINSKIIESKMSELEHLSLNQTISKVDALINSGNGDAGRLYHILEFLKSNRPLYHSDRVYLENKLQSSFSTENEPKTENELLPKIQVLIDSGNGDPGRLQFIYDTLANNRTLYRSDSLYLESKLNSSISDSGLETIPKPTQETITKPTQETITKPTQETITKPTQETITKPTQEIQNQHRKPLQNQHRKPFQKYLGLCQRGGLRKTNQMN